MSGNPRHESRNEENRKNRAPVPRLIIAAAALLLLGVVAYKAASLYYPLKYEAVIEEASLKYGLPPPLVFGLIHAESKFRADVVSRASASGLMQLIRETADWGALEIGLEGYSYDRILEPEINIEIGCWYLRRLIDQFGSVDVALAAYNGGSGNVAKWLKDPEYSDDGLELRVIPFRETENFVKRVNRNMKIYELILKYFGKEN